MTARAFYGGTASPLAGNLLTSGEEVFPREFLTSSAIPLATGQARLTYFTARKRTVSTQCRTISGATPVSGAAPTVLKIGLWRIAASGDGTLVASTAHTSTLWAAASTTYTTAWVAPVTLDMGQRYAFAPMVVTAGTAPSFAGHSIINNAEAILGARMTGLLTGLTDLGDFVAASLVSSGTRPYGVILP